MSSRTYYASALLVVAKAFDYGYGFNDNYFGGLNHYGHGYYRPRVYSNFDTYGPGHEPVTDDDAHPSSIGTSTDNSDYSSSSSDSHSSSDYEEPASSVSSRCTDAKGDQFACLRVKDPAKCWAFTTYDEDACLCF
jgi:hypothetical protein